MNIFVELKHSKYHEWIIFDAELSEGEVMGSIEAVKTVSDIFIPFAGKVIKVGERLESESELVNSDPYGEGCLARIEIIGEDDMTHLLDADGYNTK